MKKIFLIALGSVVVSACMSTMGSYESTYTTYYATYSLSLRNVQRPEKASQKYGAQEIDTITTDKKYKFSFEDALVKILWAVNSRNIAFLLENKSGDSIKIPWDRAAFVDENGRSHRVMHTGIKYNEKEKPMPPSIVMRKSSIEDFVFPTDYVYWQEGSRYTTGSWEKKPFFVDYDFHGSILTGTYPSFDAFETAAESNVGKTIQVLLPLQIEDIVNDYVFMFVVDDVTTTE